ncbi:hypothetical protein N7475_003787 [Penicillium sp. IBT 31633x]|nr:hypothetical protein N7475_003787 [Penicillium sp. IBT 31633x]
MYGLTASVLFGILCRLKSKPKLWILCCRWKPPTVLTGKWNSTNSYEVQPWEPNVLLQPSLVAALAPPPRARVRNQRAVQVHVLI